MNQNIIGLQLYKQSYEDFPVTVNFIQELNSMHGFWLHLLLCAVEIKRHTCQKTASSLLVGLQKKTGQNPTQLDAVYNHYKHTICRMRWKLLPWKLNACSNSTLSSTVHSSGNGVKFGRSARAFSKLCLCQNNMPSACI